MTLKDENWLRRHQHTLVYLGGGGGGALSNTFFVSLFSYFTVIFTFTNYSPCNILIKFLEFNYLNYWILLSISLLHLIIFIKYKNYIDLKINYYNDININNIIYHIAFVTVLYIIGIITQFNIFIFWAINHIIINLLFIIYLYINYIYALYTVYIIEIPNLAILNSLALKKDELIEECKSYYCENSNPSIVNYIIAINYSYVIINILLNIKSKYIKDIIISIIRSIISK